MVERLFGQSGKFYPRLIHGEISVCRARIRQSINVLLRKRMRYYRANKADLP